MSSYALTSSPTWPPSSSTAYPVHLALPTTSSESLTAGPSSSTELVPTHASIDLPRDWAFPSGCDFPGASYFSSEFANSRSFPTSWFGGSDWGTGTSCAWRDTSSSPTTSSSTSTSNLPSPTLASASPAHAGLTTAAIIGIAVGAGVVAILLATGLVFCIMRRRNRHRDASDSASASLLPVAYPITRRRGCSTSTSGASSPSPSEIHVGALSKRVTAGAESGESTSVANCSVMPRLSVSSPLPGSVTFAGPALPDGPSRAEKALMQLRDRERRPAVSHQGAPANQTEDGGIAAEAPSGPPEDVPAGARSSLAGGGTPLGGGRGVGQGGAVDDFCEVAPEHSSDSDLDSRETLPPPYSSHPSFEQQAI